MLGHIKLFNGKYLINQINFTEENTLFQNIILLSCLNADKIYMKQMLEKYGRGNGVDINDLLLILEMFANYQSFPYFLKELKFNNIYFHRNCNYNLNNNSIFNKLSEIISKEKIKEDRNNEIKKNAFLSY